MKVLPEASVEHTSLLELQPWMLTSDHLGHQAIDQRRETGDENHFLDSQVGYSDCPTQKGMIPLLCLTTYRNEGVNNCLDS